DSVSATGPPRRPPVIETSVTCITEVMSPTVAPPPPCGGVTVTGTGDDVLLAKLTSPKYCAVMLCGPGVRTVVSTAVPVLALSGSLANSTPLSRNSTLLASTGTPAAVGAVTEAVKVTDWPELRLVAEAVRMVDVGIGCDGELTFSSSGEELLGLKSFTPR